MAEEVEEFDRDRLEQMVNEIGGYLAELYYIEDVLRLHEEYDHSRWFLVGFSTAHRPTSTITVELGIPEFRYTLDLRVLPDVEQDVLNQLEEHRKSAVRKAEGDIGYLQAGLGPLVHPTVTAFDLIDGRLRTIQSLHRIRTEDDFGKLSELSSDWYGLAAKDFFNEFYNPFSKVREVQESLIKSVRAGFAISKGIVRFSQNSLMNAVVNTHEALREQLQAHSAGAPGVTNRQVLMVTSGALSILSTAVNVNRIWAITAELASQIVGYTAQKLPDDADEVAIQGQTADEIFDSLVQAKRVIDEYVSNQTDELRGQLAEVKDEVDALRHRLHPARPHLADSEVRGPSDKQNDPDEFYFRGPEE
jgi:hypothetical protein